MKYGCIGEHLRHSFSKEIHNILSDYEYELKEIPKDKIDEFMTEHNFKSINVTIPYKEAVIPYLHYIDDSAKEIGAVNTIVNRDGLLYGYNTDFYGMSMLITHAELDLRDKKVAILGTGGTSKTANAVANALLSKEIITVSRTKKEGTITYEELYEHHRNLDIIINTTPLGMFPDNFTNAVDIKRFTNLSGVIDAVYNPLRTQLIYEAKKSGIKGEGGLYMLVSQAVLASEIFLREKYEEGTIDNIFEKLIRQKKNIVLIGMPSSGKSTVGKEIAKRLGRRFYDTDEIIKEKANNEVFEIILSMGEKHFRKLESDVIRELSKETGVVIATGGGAVLNEENVSALAQNGRIYFLDRPIELLFPTKDRPITNTKEKLSEIYNARYHIYESSADVKIEASGTMDEILNAIIGDFEK